jgi:molybdopterin/thiamine biosynthesis adenylyltransferase
MVQKIRLRESIYILEESESTYQIIFTSTRKIQRFNVDGLVKRVIYELSQEKDAETLIKDLSRNYNAEDVSSCLSSMERYGIIRRYTPTPESRYSRQILFLDELTNSWEETLELQKKLQNSVVSVFGVGGIGSWIVNGLYQIGIGEIRITDPDRIERSNLNRQLFFTESDIGKFKVDVVKEKLPDARIIPFKKTVSKSEDLEDIISGSNFLVNCADSPSVEETTRIIDTYSKKHDIPYCVAGGYNMHLGMVGPIIVPGKTSSLDDFIRHQKDNDPLSMLKVVKDIEQTGNLGPIAGAIANIQVMEILKYLISKGSINFNKFAEIDFMDLNIDWRNF